MVFCPSLLVCHCLYLRPAPFSVSQGILSSVFGFANTRIDTFGIVPIGYGSTEAGAITNDSGNLQGGIQFKLRDLPELGYLSMRVSSSFFFGLFHLSTWW
jgi:hypothetical protein